MADNEQNKSLEMLERFNANIREAISKNFPCAFEQYVCISVPGTVVDTRQGGNYLPKANGMTADERNNIQCNEARLVDSMIPLDKVMLGPTGKSVTRSYFTSLDMLVPRKTDVGTFNLGGQTNQDANGAEYKYTQAMDYLRKAAPGVKKTDLDVQGSKDSLVKSGLSPSTVDIYVQKQLAWTSARQKWDAARTLAIETNPTLQTAAGLTNRLKELKSAQGELHARWMDWVVNGDKLKVDYAFAVVDRDTIMSRIEKAKESTRDSMITGLDGVDWAMVNLEPPNWASLCRNKALAWKSRHPGNPAHLQLKLDSLRSMKESYTAYDQQLAIRYTSGSGPAITPVPFDPLVDTFKIPDGPPPEPKSATDAVKTEDDRVKGDAKSTDQQKVEIANKLIAYEKYDKAKADDGKATTEDTKSILQVAKWRVAIFENDSTRKEIEKINIPKLDKSAIAEKETDLVKALTRLYAAEKADITSTPQTKAELTNAMSNWVEKNAALKESQGNAAAEELSAGGLRNLKASVASRLTSLDGEITALESRLEKASSAAVPGMIVGVDNVAKSIIKSTPDHTGADESSDDADSADVWTDIAFTVTAKTDDNKSSESSKNGAFSLETRSWWHSSRTNVSVSESDKKVESFMASANISGSFSAMLVNVKRNWLHAELFQDYDIDLGQDTWLSPGAKTIKHWVETGDTEFGGKLRTNYGKFPAYPTSFIVAASASFEISSSEIKSEDIQKILETDSNASLSVGCFGWGGSVGGDLKTSDKNSAQHTEVKDGKLMVSFQAPQIIGWVSEILPELPRGDVPKFGGLNGGPMMGFRASL